MKVHILNDLIDYFCPGTLVERTATMISANGIFVWASLLVIAFTTGHIVQAKTCCEALVGVWKNELGSEVNLLKCMETGLLVGAYTRAVGNASSIYRLYGKQTVGTPDSTCLVGWFVAWNNKYGNSRSVTSWSGIYQYAADIIYTQWILTSDVSSKDMWKSSMINHDEFRRKA